MNGFCGNCFNNTLNEQGICTLCGFDADKNHQIAPHGLPAGTILNGRYIIGRVLGQGGFGITYTARDHQTGQLMAVKEFFPDSMAIRTDRTSVTPFQGERGENFTYGKSTFLQEAETMAQFIGNPNIVRVYSYFEENGTAYFAMEYVDGVSFLQHLKSHGGKISLEEALKYLYPVMDALSAVHEKGIIHRDVTPDNIYISKDGTVKLLDFGAARYSLGDMSHSLDVILKHGFAPREQYKRRGRQGPYTDVYSLGATLYYAITGIRPDDALERVDEDTVALPSALGVEISKEQEAVLMKAMSVDPEDRFQTMAEFREALLRTKSTPKPEEKKAPSIKEKTAQAEKNTSTAPKRQKKAGKKPKWLIPAAIAAIVCTGALFMLPGQQGPSVSIEPTEMVHATQETEESTATTIPLTPEEIAYNEAVDLFYNEEYGKAAIAFAKLGDFRDAKEISFKIWDAIAKRRTIVATTGSTLAVKADGTVVSCGRDAPDVDSWNDIVSVAIPANYGSYSPVAGLHSDGTVVVSNTRTGSHVIEQDGWKDIVAIECIGYHLVGLKSDGTLVTTSREFPNADHWISDEEEAAYQEKIAGLSDIVEFSENLAKYADGRMMVDFEVVEYSDVIDRYTCHYGVVWLKRDGTIIFDQSSRENQSSTDIKMAKDLSSWTDIVSFSGSGNTHILGLKSDGTVVASGDNWQKQLNVDNWTDIAAISSGWYHSVGLKQDGTLVTCGSTMYNARKPTEKWTGIKLPADRDTLLDQIRPRYITESQGDQTEIPSSAVDISENILMGLGVSDLELRRISTRTEAKKLIPNYPLFNLSVKRKNVQSITFLNTLADAPSDAVDASALGNGKVKAWAEKNGELYDVYVAAEGGVLAPEDCHWLFGFLPNLTDIQFNNSFDTSNVTSMARMFDSCENLKNLDLSGFDTSNVTSLGGMFMDCTKLETVDMTSFNTSCVTTMGGYVRYVQKSEDIESFRV